MYSKSHLGHLRRLFDGVKREETTDEDIVWHEEIKNYQSKW